MTRYKYEHSSVVSPSIFTLKERTRWHQQFIDQLRAVLYNPEAMVTALNVRASFTINGHIHHNLTADEIGIAIQAMQHNNFNTYGINNFKRIEETLLQAGIANDELEDLSLSEKIMYDAAIHYALAPLFFHHPHTEQIGDIQRTFNRLSATNQTSDATSEYARLQHSFISAARHEIKRHQRFITNYDRLMTLNQSLDLTSEMHTVMKRILAEVSTLVGKPEGYSQLEKLIQVLKQCGDAIEDPSLANALLCAQLSQQTDTRSLSHTLRDLLIIVAGLTLIAMSLLTGLETFGLAAPVSALGVSMGFSLLAGSTLCSSVVGAGSAAAGMHSFFKDIKQSNLSHYLDTLATLADEQNIAHPTVQ